MCYIELRCALYVWYFGFLLLIRRRPPLTTGTDTLLPYTTLVRSREVLRSVKLRQMVGKIVHDELVGMLGSDSQAISLNAPAPVPILMVGLQGGGKTTTTAKIAKRLKDRDRTKVLMASHDVPRPTAREQLPLPGEQVRVAPLPTLAGQPPPASTQPHNTAPPPP